jgi:hypothetical protein
MIGNAMQEVKKMRLTAEEDEVLVVEAIGGELGAEDVDGVLDVGEHVGVAEARRPPVAPPRRHVERRPARLQQQQRIISIHVTKLRRARKIFESEQNSNITSTCSRNFIVNLLINIKI